MSFKEMSGLHSQTSRIGSLGPICEIFTGTEGGSAILSVQATPGGRGRHAMITINAEAAQKIAAIRVEHLLTTTYEADPVSYETQARLAFLDAVPEMTSAIMFARTADATVIEVRGLPTPAQKAQTPEDGVVLENAVQGHVFNLVGSVTGPLGLCGFSYSSENEGRLLRAVSPVSKLALQASSQGFADDLGWHQDNANRQMVIAADPHSSQRGPMNEYQAFVCVRPDEDVPMDLASLEDIVAELASRHGSMLVDKLHAPEFGIFRPSSHGGGLDVEGVPLLAVDEKNHLHGRFHAGNVVGMTPEAQAALDAFRQACAATRSRIEVDGREGALLIYDNTRVMHRRRKFTPRFDGADRYYIRIYMMNLDGFKQWKHCANGRVFA